MLLHFTQQNADVSHAVKIVTAAEMRQIEQRCALEGLPPDALMENAGRAVAEAVKHDAERGPVVVLVGPGNNGGDGLVAARYLHGMGKAVTVYLLTERPADDENLRRVREHGIRVVEAGADPRNESPGTALFDAAVAVDAVFGTGKLRPLSGSIAEALRALRGVKRERPDLSVVAVDLPSGMDADTGLVDPLTPQADRTLTLGFPKPGLFNLPGAERAGRIEVLDIGIPARLADLIRLDMIDGDWVRPVLPRRPLVANKGTFGKVMVVAGSSNYVGAAYLACSAAARVGAGLVTLAIAAGLQPVLATRLTEATYLPLPDDAPVDAAKAVRQAVRDYQAMLVGCGLGQSPAAQSFLRALLFAPRRPPVPLVIDADGLNWLAKVPEWWRRLPDDAILTPHPGEMARLTGLSVEEIQRDRVGVARKMAAEWRKVIVLKGAYTVVAGMRPARAVTDVEMLSYRATAVSPFANPALASAGTGDVLAGAIAGLLAQGLPPFEAAVAGVYLHGLAGEMVAGRMGDTGVLASDLLPELPLAVKHTKAAGGKENRASSR